MTEQAMDHCEPGCSCCTTTDSAAPIVVTINPEGRVNVARGSAPLPVIISGEWVEVPFAVINEGYVTGPLDLRARPVAGLELDLPQHILTGRDQQLSFRVRCAAPAITDLELRFFARAALGGLADHNTLSVILDAAVMG